MLAAWILICHLTLHSSLVCIYLCITCATGSSPASICQKEGMRQNVHAERITRSQFLYFEFALIFLVNFDRSLWIKDNAFYFFKVINTFFTLQL